MLQVTELLKGLELSDITEVERLVSPTPDPLWALAMPADRSFDRWHLATQKAKRFGYLPVGVGSTDDLNYLQAHLDNNNSWDSSENIRLATQLNLKNWFSERHQDLEEDNEGSFPRGVWPTNIGPKNSFWFPFDRQGNHLDPWWMLLVPAQESWLAPISLAYGNWNECPAAYVHAALLQYWGQRFGASLAGISGDTVEMSIDNPPSTQEESLSLALEHYLYCPDIVDQGCETIEHLAALLMNGHAWSFWWD
ncbi:DUF4253 domain-containing protein [Acaryochloris marina]|nr:DUF4253 domain-containing protein [Acaryochloris marina]BDM80994.1 hypothetical protein AM10699_38610 [Acaryochloris marina MBIC10699]